MPDAMRAEPRPTLLAKLIFVVGGGTEGGATVVLVVVLLVAEVARSGPDIGASVRLRPSILLTTSLTKASSPIANRSMHGAGFAAPAGSPSS